NFLRGNTPYERVCKAWPDDPDRFKYDPPHLTSGLTHLVRIGFAFGGSLLRWSDHSTVHDPRPTAIFRCLANAATDHGLPRMRNTTHLLYPKVYWDIGDKILIFLKGS